MEPNNHQDLFICRIIIKENLVKTQQKIKILRVVILGKIYQSHLTLNIHNLTDPYDYNSFGDRSYRQSDYKVDGRELHRFMFQANKVNEI